MANIARPTKIWDQALNDWVFLAGVVDTTKSYTYTADQTFPGITVTSLNGAGMPGRNKILNGDFSIWQRGTSGGNGFLADRWYLNAGAATSFTQTRQSFTPGSAPAAAHEGKYFWRNSITNVGSETAWYLNTYIEDVQTFAGQTATFSFWAKADSARTISPYLYQNFGTGGSTGVTVVTSTFTLLTTWQRYTTTVTLPSIAGKTIGAGSYLMLFFAATPATGFVLDLWGMQLEPGSVATPFMTNTGNQQAELAACQRYYEKSYSQGTDPGASVFAGISGNASGADSTGYTACITAFKVTKRTAPSITVYDTSGNINKVTSFRNDGTNTANKTATIDPISDSGFRIYETGTLKNGLFYHYVASAEL